MRRVLLPALLAILVAPAAALAIPSAPGDGTLSVRDGDGGMTLKLARGAVIGRIGSGVITVVNPADGDCTALKVWDDGELAVPEERFVISSDDLSLELQCRFEGQSVRFRLAGSDGDAFRFRGTNIGLSAVGKGTGSIKGNGGFFDGLWALNGDDYQSLPDEKRFFRLADTSDAEG